MSVFSTGSGTGPKQGRSPGVLLRLPWQLWKRWGPCIIRGAVAFCLAPACGGTIPLPLLLGYLCSLEREGGTLLAGLAGSAALLLYRQGTALYQDLAGVLLALLGAGLLSGTGLRKKPWVGPLLAGIVCLVTYGTFLLTDGTLHGQELGRLALQLLAATGSQWAFSRGRQAPEGPAHWCRAALVVLGLCQVLVLRVLDPGLMLAAALSLGGISLPGVLFCGLAVELAQITPVPVTAVLCLCALVGKAGLRHRGRALLPAVGALGAGFLRGGLDPVLIMSFLAGGCVGTLLTHGPGQQTQESGPEAKRLCLAGQALEQVARILEETRLPSHTGSRLFDEAAREACPGCSRWQRCWETESDQTYGLLAGALPGLLEGGSLPPAFLHRCRRQEAFSRAVGRGLEGLRLRRQLGARLAEQHRALTRQYGLLARYLQNLSHPEEKPRPRFRVELGISQQTPPGNRVSGDGVSRCSGPAGVTYLLLCDGMGTDVAGATAAREAQELLEHLLEGGIGPEEALGTLNDFYILSGHSGYAAIDLVELHPDTGRAVLYKWGGTPSYLKRGNWVQVLGTGGPPPGLGIGSAYGPEVVRLSMSRGQTLLLVSDGVSGEELTERIAGARDWDPQALADALIQGVSGAAEDDRTAVAVCLVPLPLGPL